MRDKRSGSSSAGRLHDIHPSGHLSAEPVESPEEIAGSARELLRRELQPAACSGWSGWASPVSSGRKRGSSNPGSPAWSDALDDRQYGQVNWKQATEMTVVFRRQCQRTLISFTPSTARLCAVRRQKLGSLGTRAGRGNTTDSTSDLRPASSCLRRSGRGSPANSRTERDFFIARIQLLPMFQGRGIARLSSIQFSVKRTTVVAGHPACTQSQ